MNSNERIITKDDKELILDAIMQHRYPVKNTAIMMLLFESSLKVQDLCLLEIGDVCDFNPVKQSFKLKDTVSIYPVVKKNADTLKRNKSTSNYQPEMITFSVIAFNEMVSELVRQVNLGLDTDPRDFYPKRKLKNMRLKYLELKSIELRAAIVAQLNFRLSNYNKITSKDPLFISQMGNSYSSNTLQEHIALIVRKWAGLEGISSHCFRKSFIQELIHDDNMSLKKMKESTGLVSIDNFDRYLE